MGELEEWKGFYNVSPREFYSVFKRREWFRILLGEDLVLIPFLTDYEPIKMENYEDEEWEYMGEIITIWKGTKSRVRLVIFRRR